MLAPRPRTQAERELRAKRAMRRGVFYIVFLVFVIVMIKWPQLVLRYLP
jgi:hypothetical protein